MALLLLVPAFSSVFANAFTQTKDLKDQHLTDQRTQTESAFSVQTDRQTSVWAQRKRERQTRQPTDRQINSGLRTKTWHTPGDCAKAECVNDVLITF